MAQLRDLFVALGVVYALDLTGRLFFRYAFDPITSLFGSFAEADSWVNWTFTFLTGACAGFLLMRLLVWKWRAIAIVSLALVYSVAVPLWWRRTVESEYGFNPDTSAVIEMAIVPIVFTLGVSLMVIVSRATFVRRTSDAPPNTSLERTREG
jgi:hypothetical protein